MAAVTELGQGSYSASNGSIVITTSAAVAAGDAIVLFVTQRKTDMRFPSSIVDTAGNTYTLGPNAQATGSTFTAGIYTVTNAAAMASGSTITLTWAVTVPGVAAASAIKISGMATASLVDASNAVGNAGSTTPSASCTDANADVVVACVATSFVSGESYTEDGNYTSITGANSSSGTNDVKIKPAYRLSAPAGSNTYAPTLGVSHPWIDCVMGLNVAASAAQGSRLAMMGCGV